MAKLQVIRQDDLRRTVYVKNKDGSPYDLTNCQIFFTVKTYDHLKDTDDNSVIIKKSVAIVDASGGEALLTLTSVETDIDENDYYYDFQIIDAQGRVTSCVKDNFEVNQDVTKRTISL